MTMTPDPLDWLVDQMAPFQPSLVMHDAGGGQECVIRRGEIVTSRRLLTDVRERTGSRVDRVKYRDDLGLAQMFLRESERQYTVEIANDLAGKVKDPEAERDGLPTGVAVNHVLFGCTATWVGSPIWSGTPIWVGTAAGLPTDHVLPAPVPPPGARAVNVGVLDTGLDPHPWFGTRDWYPSDVDQREILDGNNDRIQDRQAGHGTFVSGVVLQNAPSAVIRSARTLSSMGVTDDVTVATKLRAVLSLARENNVRLDVVNLSLGGYTSNNECPATVSSALREFGDTVIVAAAGNNGSDRKFWPAAMDSVIAVNAFNEDGSRADFSNYGPWVNAAAPGVNVSSSFVQLDAGARDYGFAKWSGTSFAAPVVAGEIAAELATNPALTPDEAVGLVVQRHPVV